MPLHIALSLMVSTFVVGALIVYLCSRPQQVSAVVTSVEKTITDVKAKAGIEAAATDLVNNLKALAALGITIQLPSSATPAK
jgi:hypothetical protein